MGWLHNERMILQTGRRWVIMSYEIPQDGYACRAKKGLYALCDTKIAPIGRNGIKKCRAIDGGLI
jgi:hypothetical protein